MNDKENILIVHNYYQIPGGEDIVVENEKKMLKEYGHKVFFYSRDNSELKSMNIFQKLLLPFSTIFNIKTYREVKRIIKNGNISVVHVHNTLNLVSPSVYYAAKDCNVPIVQTIHNFRLLCPGATFYRDGHVCEECIEKGMLCAIKYSCYRNSKIQTLACVISAKFHRMTKIYEKINYICLTEFNKEKLLKFKQIDSRRVFIKPNFVECSEVFVPKERRLNQFVFAGRLDKLKGIDILFAEWKRMGIRAPKLIVCGTGPMESWCNEFVDNNSVNIELKGFLSNDDVRKIVAESKALILPTQWYEGFPMSVVEAFSVGTPVISSALGNLGSIVMNGINGYKIETTIEDCLNHIHDGMFESTYQHYLQHYTKSQNYKLLREIYLKIINS